MKKINIPRSTIRKINSMNELKLEKARLKLELLKTEDKIEANFRHIRSAFSFRNIFSTATTDLINPSSILMKVFTLGKNWLGRRKKKKKSSEPHPQPLP
jgi:hypothetical protein